jgi:hypothetical protein
VCTGCVECEVEARTHRRQDLGHIPHQVVINLSGVDDHQLSTLCGQRGLNILRAEPAEPIPMLDHDPRHRRVAQQSKELAAVTVQRRTDLGHDLVDRDLLSRGPRGYPRHLTIEICFLIGRRHPRIHRSS